jgi:hypothetical protein
VNTVYKQVFLHPHRRKTRFLQLTSSLLHSDSTGYPHAIDKITLEVPEKRALGVSMSGEGTRSMYILGRFELPNL